MGATCADNIARAALAQELVILDIKEGLAEGKAQDMMQTAALLGFDTRITGSTNDYSKTAGSDVVVITSGLQQIRAGQAVQIATEEAAKESPQRRSEAAGEKKSVRLMIR